jgi:predicted MFS family arabinose efflux permease
MPTPHRVFYGWYVVGAVSVITTATSGLAFYNLPILLAAFVAERGFPVALASSATATFFIAAGFGGMLAGRLVDRIDARLVIAGGAAFSAAALASVGVLSEAWKLFAFHLAFGFSYGFIGLVPVTTVLARWFNARRSLALSLGSTGLSLGGIVVAPVVALAIERNGLAAAAPWMALAMLAGVVPVALLVLRGSPQAMGLEPDGLSPAGAAAAPASSSIGYIDAIRSPYFYVVSVTFFFLLGAQVGAITHIFRLASTRVDAETAALALAVLATASTVGRLVGGGILLKVPARTFALAMMALQAASLAMLALAHGSAAILAATAVFGTTMGNTLMLHPLLLAERFGVRDYGRIYAASQMMTVVGLASCPALVGLIYEASGGYRVPYLAAAALTLVGIVILAGFDRRAAPSSA